MMSEVHTDDILQNIFDSGRECFVPRYIGSSMDMVRLHSMDDFLSLPETAWKIKQPADDAEREDALETGTSPYLLRSFVPRNYLPRNYLVLLYLSFFQLSASFYRDYFCTIFED